MIQFLRSIINLAGIILMGAGGYFVYTGDDALLEELGIDLGNLGLPTGEFSDGFVILGLGVILMFVAGIFPKNRRRNNDVGVSPENGGREKDDASGDDGGSNGGGNGG